MQRLFLLCLLRKRFPGYSPIRLVSKSVSMQRRNQRNLMSRTPLCMLTHESKWIIILQTPGSDRDNHCQQFPAVASGLFRELIVDGIAILRTLLFEKVEGPSPNLFALAFKTHYHLSGERRFAEAFTPFGRFGVCF